MSRKVRNSVFLVIGLIAMLVVGFLTQPEPPVIQATSVATKFRAYRSQAVESYIVGANAVKDGYHATVVTIAPRGDLERIHPAVAEEVRRLTAGRPYLLTVKDRLHEHALTVSLTIYAKQS